MKQKILCLLGLHEWHYCPLDIKRYYLRSCLFCSREEVRSAQHKMHPTAIGGWYAVTFLVGMVVGLLAAHLGGG